MPNLRVGDQPPDVPCGVDMVMGMNLLSYLSGESQLSLAISAKLERGEKIDF